jgi:hypothetical protein
MIVLGDSPPASAYPMLFGGTLSGANVAIPNTSLGTGTVLIVLDPTAETMQIDASFSGLTGTDTAAHIHCCSLTQSSAGGATEFPSWPGFPLGVTQGTYVSPVFSLLTSSFYTPSFLTAQGGLTQAEAALVSGIESGAAWYGMHTTTFPTGEIGTELLPASEPTSLILVASALAGFSMIRRRNRHFLIDRTQDVATLVRDST